MKNKIAISLFSLLTLPLSAAQDLSSEPFLYMRSPSTPRTKLRTARAEAIALKRLNKRPLPPMLINHLTDMAALRIQDESCCCCWGFLKWSGFMACSSCWLPPSEALINEMYEELSAPKKPVEAKSETV